LAAQRLHAQAPPSQVQGWQLQSMQPQGEVWVGCSFVMVGLLGSGVDDERIRKVWTMVRSQACPT
jgi:hypothetical protein